MKILPGVIFPISTIQFNDVKINGLFERWNFEGTVCIKISPVYDSYNPQFLYNAIMIGQITKEDINERLIRVPQNERVKVIKHGTLHIEYQKSSNETESDIDKI